MKPCKPGRALAAIAGSLLVLGMADTARADHRTSVDITIATPGGYTRFATGPRYPYGYGPPGYYAWSPPPVPVYWGYYPPPAYGHDRHDHRYDHRDDHRHDYDRRPRHHHDRDHDRGRHGNRHRHDD
ncbi:MAG: hypothetical protein IT486_10450 [Gammaproteobacteria bacterium]|nr:hypothetical protein [Gammaproteobacteria bacterium]